MFFIKEELYFKKKSCQFFILILYYIMLCFMKIGKCFSVFLSLRWLKFEFGEIKMKRLNFLLTSACIISNCAVWGSAANEWELDKDAQKFSQSAIRSDTLRSHSCSSSSCSSDMDNDSDSSDSCGEKERMGSSFSESQSAPRPLPLLEPAPLTRLASQYAENLNQKLQKLRESLTKAQNELAKQSSASIAQLREQQEKDRISMYIRRDELDRKLTKSLDNFRRMHQETKAEINESLKQQNRTLEEKFAMNKQRAKQLETALERQFDKLEDRLHEAQTEEIRDAIDEFKSDELDRRLSELRGLVAENNAEWVSNFAKLSARQGALEEQLTQHEDDFDIIEGDLRKLFGAIEGITQNIRDAIIDAGLEESSRQGENWHMPDNVDDLRDTPELFKGLYQKMCHQIVTLIQEKVNPLQKELQEIRKSLNNLQARVMSQNQIYAPSAGIQSPFFPPSPHNRTSGNTPSAAPAPLSGMQTVTGNAGRIPPSFPQTSSPFTSHLTSNPAGVSNPPYSAAPFNSNQFGARYRPSMTPPSFPSSAAPASQPSTIPPYPSQQTTATHQPLVPYPSSALASQQPYGMMPTQNYQFRPQGTGNTFQ